MERQKKVIDASVIMKWFNVEIGTKEALELRERHLTKEIIIIVPELIFMEIINGLKYKKHDENFLHRTNKALFETQFHIERTNQFIMEKAIQLSIKYNLSLYDGIYAALAQIHGCELITADEKLSKIPQGKRL
ncbi:hypothetical protein COU57_06955 [Candidatus Pacearchaeota archaeon CG10_big_fil_rev_8_21_14_0_10_32_14]|nr:MAG: hypothetical protein COU57_06955 [Candidatus Pacearchaeota archaeon CG10_big_fil_rev_8_21_14_0_10_32_14]